MAQIAKTEADMAASSAKDAGDKVAELGKQTTARQPRSPATPPAKPRPSSAKVCSQCARPSMPRPKSARTPPDAPRKAWLRSTRACSICSTSRPGTMSSVLQTLAQPANWGKAVQLQSEFLSASLQRAAQFARRYVEVSQAVDELSADDRARSDPASLSMGRPWPSPARDRHAD